MLLLGKVFFAHVRLVHLEGMEMMLLIQYCQIANRSDRDSPYHGFSPAITVYCHSSYSVRPDVAQFPPFPTVV